MNEKQRKRKQAVPKGNEAQFISPRYKLKLFLLTLITYIATVHCSLHGGLVNIPIFKVIACNSNTV